MIINFLAFKSAISSSNIIAILCSNLPNPAFHTTPRSMCFFLLQQSMSLGFFLLFTLLSHFFLKLTNIEFFPTKIKFTRILCPIQLFINKLTKWSLLLYSLPCYSAFFSIVLNKFKSLKPFKLYSSHYVHSLSNPYKSLPLYHHYCYHYMLWKLQERFWMLLFFWSSLFILSWPCYKKICSFTSFFGQHQWIALWIQI